MRLVGLEEHVVTEQVLDAWRELPARERDLAFGPATQGETAWRLLDVGAERLAAMDATGLDVQVLSLTTPGLQDLPAGRAVPLQREVNDHLAETVRARPDRFQGLATLATAAPAAAAAELERAVTRLGLNGAMVYGRTGDVGLDHPSLWPVLEAAEALRAPLHLHPQSPPAAVRAAYYSGFGEVVDAAFATFGVGWHYDAGLQFLRLALAGVFDRFPDLQVVVGHWGEMVLFFLERIEKLAGAAGLARPLGEYARENLHVAPSGILSHRYLRWALEVVGADRVVFSTDYPFEAASLGGARRFVEEAEISGDQRRLVGAGSWDRLCAAIRR